MSVLCTAVTTLWICGGQPFACHTVNTPTTQDVECPQNPTINPGYPPSLFKDSPEQPDETTKPKSKRKHRPKPKTEPP